LKDISKSWARAVRTNTNNNDHFMLLVVFDVKRVKDVVIILQTSTHNNNNNVVQFRRVRLKWTPGFTFATVEEMSGDSK